MCLLLQEMCRHAIAHIEDINAPLFLRFINLLINDAIFLLDEALSVSTDSAFHKNNGLYESTSSLVYLAPLVPYYLLNSFVDSFTFGMYIVKHWEILIFCLIH